MKSVIHSPRNEHKGAVGFPVEVVVVAVAGIAVPVTHRHFRGPEGQEAVQINGLGQALQPAVRRVLEGGRHSVDVRPIVGVFVGFLL